MTWVCADPKCKRVSKGFANGRKYCHICRRCAIMSEERRKKTNGVRR